MPDSEVKLYIRGDESGALTTMKNYAAGLKSMESETGGIMNTIKSHWIATSLAISGALVTIKKAWDLADMASAFEEQKDSLNRLAAQYNITADTIIESVQRSSKGMVAQADAVNISAEALMKGMNPEQIAKLSEAAETLSNVTGKKVVDHFRELSEALETGKLKAVKMAIGIVDLDATYGNAAASMTDAEKAQAMYNIVIDKTTALQQTMGDQAESTNDKMEKFTTTLKDGHLALGQLVLRATEFVVSIAQSITAWSLVALSGISKLAQGLGWLLEKVPLVSSLGTSLKNWGAASASAAMETANEQFKKSNDNMSLAWDGPIAAQKALVNKSLENTQASLKKEQDALTKSLKDRLPLYEKYYTDLKKLQEDYKSAIEKSLKDIADIDKKILESRRTTQEILYDIQQKGNPAANEMEEYSRKAMKLDSDLAYAMTLSGEDKVKALQDYQKAWKDMVKEISYTDVERRLDTSGGLGASAEFKDVEIKKTWLALGDSMKIASGKAQEAGNIIVETQEEMSAAATGTAQKQIAAFNMLTDSVNAADEWVKYLKKTIEDLDKGLVNPRTFTLDCTAALAQLEQVQNYMNQIASQTGVQGSAGQMPTSVNSKGVFSFGQTSPAQNAYNSVYENNVAAGMMSLMTGIEQFASGTNYVPRNMLAFIHKGEKITPAAENKGSSNPVSVTFSGDIIISGASGNPDEIAKNIVSSMERELKRRDLYRS